MYSFPDEYITMMKNEETPRIRGVLIDYRSEKKKKNRSNNDFFIIFISFVVI